MAPCLAELAGEGAWFCGELMTTAGPVTAVFLVPFHRAGTSLAATLRQLLTCREDRMPSFATTDRAAAFG